MVDVKSNLAQAVGVCMLDTLIHLYGSNSVPFRSLSALSDAEAIRVMRALYRRGSVYWERFEDPQAYWALRRQTEQWLRRDFIAKGGRPHDPYPIYMIYGRTNWVQASANELTQATTRQIEVPLALFEPEEISFTYPDSMVSAMMAAAQDLACYLPEFHGRVFTLEEIQAVVAALGLPGETWGTTLPSHLANYIEAQIWNHRRLHEYWEVQAAKQGPARVGA
jgi:hypothetical protein